MKHARRKAMLATALMSSVILTGTAFAATPAPTKADGKERSGYHFGAKMGGKHFPMGENMKEMKAKFDAISAEDKAALKLDHQNKDQAAAQKILDKYGIKMPEHMGQMPAEMKVKFDSISAEDKALLKTAHENKDKAAAQKILDKYGIKQPENMGMMGHGHRRGAILFKNISDADKALLKTAHDNKDEAAIKAILLKYKK